MQAIDERQQQPQERVRGDARDLLYALAEAAGEQRLAEIRQVELVAALIDVYSGGLTEVVTGAERLVPSGAVGTPNVAEFLPLEVAPLLGIGVPQAWALIRDVANLRHRHPRLWEAVGQARLPVWQARKLAAQVAAAGLDAEAAAWVDEQLAPSVDRLSWSRLRARARGLIVRADTALAAARAERARRERFVSVRHEADGMSTILARTSTTTAVLLEAALDRVAGDLVLAEPGLTAGQARADALAVLLTPQSETARPTATLYVHMAAETLTDATHAARVVRVEGVGPVLLGQVRELLGHHRVRVVPVLDLAGDPVVDAYEIPERVREQVVLRDPVEVFPFSTRSARRCDLDHTIPYRRGRPGQTRPSNLGPLGRPVHRAKTHHAGWRVDQPEPGHYVWTSPFGFRYHVDRTGTQRLT